MSDTPLRLVTPPTPAGSADPPLVVDARRLAAMLGASVRAVRSWDASGRLPKPLRIGGRVVWRVSEICAWLDAGAPDRGTWEARRAARS
jgi:predicted DNA-binding transcriptional regulator AlpA